MSAAPTHVDELFKKLGKCKVPHEYAKALATAVMEDTRFATAFREGINAAVDMESSPAKGRPDWHQVVRMSVTKLFTEL